MREVIWEVSNYINSYNCILLRKRSSTESCFLTKGVSASVLAHYFLWPAIILERFCIRVWTNSRSEVWTHIFLWWFFFLTYKETWSAKKLPCILAFRSFIKGIDVQIHFSLSQNVHALVQERCHNKLASKVKWKNSFLDLFIYRACVWDVSATYFAISFNLTTASTYESE